MGLFGPTCPKCGSDNVTKRKLSKKEISNNLVGAGGKIEIENTNCEFKCHNCGKKWIDTCGFLEKFEIKF